MKKDFVETFHPYYGTSFRYKSFFVITGAYLSSLVFVILHQTFWTILLCGIFTAVNIINVVLMILHDTKSFEKNSQGNIYSINDYEHINKKLYKGI